MQNAIQLLYQGYASVTKVLIVENEIYPSAELNIANPVVSLFESSIGVGRVNNKDDTTKPSTQIDCRIAL